MYYNDHINNRLKCQIHLFGGFKNVEICSGYQRKSAEWKQFRSTGGFLSGGGGSCWKSCGKITLKGKHFAFCKGCLACQKTQKCVIQDDAIAITEKMCHADVIVFATPVYYYSMSGQLKTLLDRANSLFASDYAFRDIYLLTTAAEDEESTPEGTETGIQGWIDCFEKAELKGTVFAGGVNDVGEMDGHPALQKAYHMGTAV